MRTPARTPSPRMLQATPKPRSPPYAGSRAAAATDSGDAGANGLVLSEREGRFASNLTARAQQALASYGSTATLGAEPNGSSSVVGLDLYA
ncbi:hypothetical protein Q3H58_004179 [Pseudomonas psychrotolerans]|nr:hypothetical protein [Pseudomonas psychrotolerans]